VGVPERALLTDHRKGTKNLGERFQLHRQSEASGLWKSTQKCRMAAICAGEMQGDTKETSKMQAKTMMDREGGDVY